MNGLGTHAKDREGMSERDGLAHCCFGLFIGLDLLTMRIMFISFKHSS